jgi:uncharacterized protein (DUF952 family)
MLIYKIINAKAWQSAVQAQIFHGASIDLADGYIHLSTAKQAEETAKRHFHGQTDLLLVAFEAEEFGAQLKWEASRGGDLFPHVYGAINPVAARWAKPLPWVETAHIFPAGWAA